MGLADRDYYREPSSTEPGFRLSATMVNRLILINVIIFAVDYFLTFENHAVMATLAIEPAALFQPWLWWKFISYGFAHSPNDHWHLISNMFMLWMFGRDVERVYGARQFLGIYLAAILLGSLTWVLREWLFTGIENNQPPIGVLLGASGAVTAITILYCLQFPRRMILFMGFIPLPAWVFGIILILMNMTQIGPDNVAYDVHLAGAAFGFIYYKAGWNLGRLLPFGTGGGKGGTSWKSSFRQKPKLRVHVPDEQQQRLDLEADRILQKLHTHGEEGLTEQERHILQDYSQRMQQKHR